MDPSVRAPVKASLGDFPSLQGSLFLPGKVRVETQLCTTQDLCAETMASRHTALCNMHEKMSVLSKIIPSALPVSAEHPLPICVPVTIYSKRLSLDWHLEAAVVSGCSESWSP